MNRSLGLVTALAVLFMLALSPIPVSAKHIVHLEVTIAPGTTYQDPQDLHKGEILSCAWTTDHPVIFFLTDSDGVTIRNSNGTVGQAIVEITETGTYTFNWKNDDDQSVSLIFDKGFIHSEQSSNLWMIALAILIALIALMLAAIVYLSMKNMRKK